MKEYQQQLQSSPEALAYLKEERGLEEDVIEYLGFGFIEEPYTPDHSTGIGRLAIPYLSAEGVPTAWKFRSMDNSTPKYIGVSGQRVGLYNAGSLPRFPNADTVVVTEGELDAAMAVQMGLEPVVGLPGVNSWKPHFKRVLEGFENVIVFTDSDDKGQGAELGSFLRKELSEQDVKIIPMPESHDFNSAYLEFGAGGLMEYINELYV